MRVAIVYDCIFPHTVGGAERWYTQLAQRLQEEGHSVTYLTLRQWPKGESADEPFEVRTVGPRMPLYTDSGRRRIWPPLRFGAGVFWHLLWRGGRYEIVHGASFPYFSVIGAHLALAFHRNSKLVIDWHEVWTLDYWNSYLGAVGGRIGYGVQALCKLLPDANFTESKMHEERLPAGSVTRLTGLFEERDRPAAPAPASIPPHVVFAGRHIPEKNVAALPAALAAARREIPDLRATIFGDGPEFDRVATEIARVGAGDFVTQAGFVDFERVQEGISTAACVVLPSIREGYGMVVIEAACMGTPTVVVAGPDNAATELIDPGVNGLVAESANPEVLGAAIIEVVRAGEILRHSTWEWYETHRDELSCEDSLVVIESLYERLRAQRIA